MIKPIHYTIIIEPDLHTCTFEGSVAMQLRADEATNRIILDARDLSLGAVSVRQGEADARDCEFSVNDERQEVEILLPQSLSGEFELSIRYAGVINDQYVGFYRSRYRHDGQDKIMASTQFEAKEARRAFPCFDRPHLKATFDIEFVIDEGLTGISNAAVRDVRSLAGGKKSVRFKRTPPMSTYLVFFGIGEFEFLEDDSAQPVVRVATAPGKREFGRYALDIARKTLAFGESYLDIPYPLSKCDYIAIPDSMGAMENYGAIRHAEDVLLVYPEVTSRASQALIVKVITHEGIHMWFGDLVSPAKWKNVWLNEAFASYFNYVIPHHYYPEWGVWEQFFHERLLSGMERDSLAGSIPIDLPSGDDSDAEPAPSPSIVPIIYNKGAAVVRMLEVYLGEDVFRQALHDFLMQYQFDSASSEQFWDAMERSSGVPLQNFARTWIHQPGYPLISVTRSGSVLQLDQRRFCYGDVAPGIPWDIPVTLALFLEDGSVDSRQILFDTASMTIEMPENTRAYKLNAGFTGVYRVKYPRENWHRLGEMIREGELSAVDSMNVLEDYFALVKAGVYTVQDYLQFVEAHCREERRYLPLTNLARNLGRLYQSGPAHRQRISGLGLPIFESALDGMGWLPQEDEPLVLTELRETLLWTSFLLGSSRVSDFIRPQFQDYLQGRLPHRDIIATVLKIGAALDGDAQSRLWTVASAPESSKAERVMALQALGNLSDQEQQWALLARNLAEIPSSLQSHMILACARSKAGSEFIWFWLRDNLSELQSWPLAAVERLIVGIIPLAAPAERESVEKMLGDFVARHPDAADSVDMARQMAAVNRTLRGD